jgi:hypothetical protein
VVLANRILILIVAIIVANSCSEKKQIIREWRSSLLISEQETFYDTLGVSDAPFFKNLYRIDNWLTHNLSNLESIEGNGEFKIDSVVNSIAIDSLEMDIYELVISDKIMGNCNLTYINGLGIVYVDCNFQSYYLIGEKIIQNGDTLKSTDYTKLLQGVLLPDSVELLNSLDSTKIIEVK